MSRHKDVHVLGANHAHSPSTKSQCRLGGVGLTAVGWGRVTRLTPKPLCLLGLASPPAQGITHVDMMSIDTENSEVAVLQGLDFSAVTVDVFVIEDAYASGVRSGW
jgi:hypothetical protein